MLYRNESRSSKRLLGQNLWTSTRTAIFKGMV